MTRLRRARTIMGASTLIFVVPVALGAAPGWMILVQLAFQVGLVVGQAVWQTEHSE